MIQHILNDRLSRSSDPLTSFMAADSARAFIPTHETKILRALSYHGAMGVDWIAEVSGLEPHAVGKRMKALHERGEVALTGTLVQGDSGRYQREWKAA